MLKLIPHYGRGLQASARTDRVPAGLGTRADLVLVSVPAFLEELAAG